MYGFIVVTISPFLMMTNLIKDEAFRCIDGDFTPPMNMLQNIKS